MGRKNQTGLVLAIMGGMWAAGVAQGQPPVRLNAPMSAGFTNSMPLETSDIPTPPVPPSRLMTEATKPVQTGVPLPGPYFERDPLLDPPELPPGWFAGLELGIVKAHVKNRVTGMVSTGGGMMETVQLPSAEMDWTVAPRFEGGYRLPAGFGEVAIAYRFLATHGNDTLPDSGARLQSRLDVNIWDLEYASREYSLGPICDMKWRIGPRLASVFFDSQATLPQVLGGTGSRLIGAGTSNRFIGVGPHAGLELARPFPEWGLKLVGRVDAASLLGRIRQGFGEDITTGGGLLVTGSRKSNPQAIPMVNAQLGLSWQPNGWNHTFFFLGYQYEYWWNVGKIAPSSGELSDQGILLTAEFNY